MKIKQSVTAADAIPENLEDVLLIAQTMLADYMYKLTPIEGSGYLIISNTKEFDRHRYIAELPEQTTDIGKEFYKRILFINDWIPEIEKGQKEAKEFFLKRTNIFGDGSSIWNLMDYFAI